MFDHPKLKLMIDPLQIEQGALSQIAQCLGIDVLEKLVICPDVHQGYDIPIGAAALIRDYIWPGAVGFDINCGMSFINTGLTLNQLSLLKMSDRLEFFEEMKHIVPTNEKGHQKAMGDYRKFPNGASDKEYEKRVLLKASEQLMTLGGGR